MEEDKDMHNAAALRDIIACDSDFRIARDGTWFHQGSPIGRQAMVRLFSTILTRDVDGAFWLVTPAERCKITVEDVPFIAIDWRVRDLGHGQTLCFKTNVNEWVAVDELHPMNVRKDPETGDVVPYVQVRDGLEAKVGRSVYYELMEFLLNKGELRNGVRGVVSAGKFFPLELRSV